MDVKECPKCRGRGMGAYLTDFSGLDDHCPHCNGTGLLSNPGACQCKHVSHFTPDLTPAGRGGHPYGERFDQIVYCRTDYGRFQVCPACYNDCYKEYRDVK